MCSSCAPDAPRHPATVSRRDMVKLAAGAGVAATGLSLNKLWASSAPRGTMLDNDITPDEALRQLYAGNQRFIDGKIQAPNRNMDRLKEVAPRQTPFAAFLGCADSRVPIEIVFDQGFGDIFVTRIAGNVADPAIIGSLEFGCAVLGAKVLYVLGHSACGAVSATMAGNAVPGQISTLYQHIRPAVKRAKGDLNAAIRANVQVQAETLAEASPVIAGLMKEGKLKIAGGVYDLASGKVTPIDVLA